MDSGVKRKLMSSELRPSSGVIERAQRRDPHAWAEIYETFSSQIYGYFLNKVRSRETAEDLTAGVFVDALQSIERFQGDMAELRAWLFSIGRHNLIDHFRRTLRRPVTSIEDVDASILATSDAADPEDGALAGVDRTLVLKAVEGLSPDQREVILLRLNGDLTSTEIARLVGKTAGAVKALQHRAMIALAKTLRGDFELGSVGGEGG